MKCFQAILAGALALAALVAGAPQDPSVPGYKPHHDNKAFTYRCNALDIRECDVSGRCAVIETCPYNCVNLMSETGPVGAGCTGKKPFKINAALVSLAGEEDIGTGATQGCGDGNKKCKKCSSDKRGVLTCQYGFCYVVPGQWCSLDSSCRDECACCKKPRIGKREAEAACTPGEYRCFSTRLSYLQVCNALGKWQLSADCGIQNGRSCCKSPSPGIAFCDCRQPAELST